MRRLSSTTALASLFLANALTAQQQDSAANPVPNQTLYVEIGGNAGTLSMNYDRKLNERFTARIGYGKWATFRSFPVGDQENDYGRLVPVMINFLSRSAPGSRNWIEVGAGMVYGEWWTEVEQNPHRRIRAATATLGYRRMGRHSIVRLGGAAMFPLTPDFPLATLRPSWSFGFAF